MKLTIEGVESGDGEVPITFVEGMTLVRKTVRATVIALSCSGFYNAEVQAKQLVDLFRDKQESFVETYEAGPQKKICEFRPGVEKLLNKICLEAGHGTDTTDDFRELFRIIHNKVNSSSRMN